MPARQWRTSSRAPPHPRRRQPSSGAWEPPAEGTSVDRAQLTHQREPIYSLARPGGLHGPWRGGLPPRHDPIAMRRLMPIPARPSQRAGRPSRRPGNGSGIGVVVLTVVGHDGLLLQPVHRSTSSTRCYGESSHRSPVDLIRFRGRRDRTDRSAPPVAKRAVTAPMAVKETSLPSRRCPILRSLLCERPYDAISGRGRRPLLMMRAPPSISRQRGPSSD